MTLEIRPRGDSLHSGKRESPQSFCSLLDARAGNTSNTSRIVVSDRPPLTYVSLHNRAVNIIKAFNHKNDDLPPRVVAHAHNIPNIGSFLTPQLNIYIAVNSQLVFALKSRDHRLNLQPSNRQINYPTESSDRRLLCPI